MKFRSKGGVTMKGNKNILVIAVLLLLIAVVSGTYAIYRSHLTANTTVNAAHWSAIISDGTNTSNTTLTFSEEDLTCTGTRHGYNNTVAPGDSCHLTFTVDLDGSEVDAKVNATVGTLTSTSGTVDSDRFTVSLTTGSTPTNADGVAQTVGYSSTEGEMEVEYTLTVTWLGDTDNLAADGKDVADVGMSGIDITIPVNIDAYQDMGS